MNAAPFRSLDVMSRRIFAERLAQATLGVTLLPHLARAQAAADSKAN